MRESSKDLHCHYFTFCMCESYHCEKASIELVKIGFLQHSEIYVFLSNSDESNTILTNIERTQTSFFETSNELECVHLLMMELEHLKFGFERTDIEHQI